MGTATAKTTKVGARITISIIESDVPGMTLDFTISGSDSSTIASGSVAKQTCMGLRIGMTVGMALDHAKEQLMATLESAAAAKGLQS